MNKTPGLDTLHDERSEFERNLLASARSEGPTPADTERAWRALEADVAALGSLAAPREVQSALRPGAATTRVQALQWLLIGAVAGGIVAGGGVVALWRPLEPSAPPPPVPQASASGLASGEPPLVPEPFEPKLATEPLEPRESASAAARPRARGASRAEPRAVSVLRRAAPPTSPVLAPDSTLAREVAALDAARAALAIGANGHVLQQIEKYHRDFPGGALAAEADVVAIEAWAAEGDEVALQRAVRRFLRNHPRDPHVARVRELQSSAARGNAP